MKEKYSIVISERQAVPRSKRMREAGQSPSSAAVLVSGTGGGNSSCDGHAHTNLPALERIGFDENDDLYLTARVGSVDDETGELTITHEKVKAGYADQAGIAHDLDKDSPVNERFLRKDQADGTDFLLEANGGLVVRKQEIVEAVLMSIVEESEDSLVEELKSSSIGGAATLGELDNVLPSADMAPNGSILVKDEEVWSPVPPTVNELTDYENMLMPVFHKVLGKWTFISVSSIMGGVIPPVSVEMILDSGILDRDTLGNDSTGVVFVLGNSILDKDKL